MNELHHQIDSCVPPKGVDVPTAIEDLLEDWRNRGYGSADINSGLCDQFAEELQDIVGGNVVLSDDIGHFWLEIGGRCYDAINVDGVEKWTDLDFARNSDIRMPRT